ncbi:MAG: esterase family protein [Candidatus Omnitrophica bacterium]|nr:esterase family protein [Candidatus Omnitrophota bacterium]MCM8769195.1 esterase family protein [Candidatus Omnitrophota bacterium]
MALLDIHFRSEVLQKQAAMYVILPENKEIANFRVVYLLHGLSDDYTIWLRRTNVERYATDYNFVLVLPDTGRFFYTNSLDGIYRYEDHMLEVVNFVDRIFPTVKSNYGRCLTGNSMGGYGSLKLAIKHPHLFGSVSAHSSLTDITTWIEGPPGQEFSRIFGKPVHPENDLFLLAEKAKDWPAVRLDCGTEDILLDHNRRFHAHLEKLNRPHIYEEFPGGHDWTYWDQHVQDSLRFHASLKET